MGNQAIYLNPPNANLHISQHGSDWLWAAFSIMAVCFLATIVVTAMRPRGTRLFHEIAVAVLATASIAYFSMASDLGSTPIRVEFRGHGSDPTRQIWYVRYIQWFINFPLLLLEVLLATGMPPSDIMITLFMGIVMVVSFLVGSLVHSTYKWGYYVFGVVSLFYIWYELLWAAPSSTFAAGGIVRRGYYAAAGYLSFMLLTYPICWACAEGANRISPTSEMIWYGILDIFTGPIFLVIILVELRHVDYNAFGLQSLKYVGTNQPHYVRSEKQPVQQQPIQQQPLQQQTYQQQPIQQQETYQQQEQYEQPLQQQQPVVTPVAPQPALTQPIVTQPVVTTTGDQQV